MIGRGWAGKIVDAAGSPNAVWLAPGTGAASLVAVTARLVISQKDFATTIVTSAVTLRGRVR
jgi:hypothetical protein